MKTAAWVTAAVLWMAAVGAALSEDFRATISGTFTNNTVAVTNTTGAKVGLAAIILTKTGTDWNTATNATITMNNGNGTFMLLAEAATNTVIYSDGKCGLSWPPSGIITFSVGCASTGGATTNLYHIYSK